MVLFFWNGGKYFGLGFLVKLMFFFKNRKKIKGGNVKSRIFWIKNWFKRIWISCLMILVFGRVIVT